MSGKQRVVRGTPALPPPYTPPIIGGGTTTHPDVTERTGSPPKKGWQKRNSLSVTYATGKAPFKYGSHCLPGQIVYSFNRPSADEFWYVLGFGRKKSEFLKLLLTANGTTQEFTTLPTSGDLSVWFYDSTQSAADSNLTAVDPTWSVEVLAAKSIAIVRLRNVSTKWTQLPSLLFDLLFHALDPLTGTVVASENPVVHFYDWLRDPEGKNLRAGRINTAAFIAARAIAAELVDGKPRFTAHMSIDGQDTADVEKTFALACDAMFFFSQNQWYIKIDRPAASVATYTDADIITDPEQGGIAPDGYREDPQNRINEVVINWTDTANGWKVIPARLQSQALKDGRETRRTATYDMPWLHDASVVQRKLTYLLNSYLFDFKLPVRHLASTSDRQVGEVITQTVPERAIAAQQFMIFRRQKNIHENTFDDLLLEYNAAKYSNEVATVPSKIASTMPNQGATIVFAVFANRQLISYDATGALSPSSQTTTFTASKQNTAAVVNWTATKADGTPITPVTNLLSAATGDSVTMSAANFHAQRGATEGVIVTGSITDGVTVSEAISILKVQTGATGATGSTGATGASGASLWTPLTMGSGTLTVFNPTSVGKTAGATLTYDASVYSAEGYVRGVVVSFRPNQTNTAVWIGFSTAPAASVTELTIEYAWVLSPAGNRFTSVSGVTANGPVAYTTATRLALTYDGYYVRWYADGVLVRELARVMGGALYLDTSFRDVSATAQAVDLTFGPMGEQGAPAGQVLAVPNSMAAIAGSLLVGQGTTKLAADLNTSATTIVVDHAVLTNGDTIVMRAVPGGVAQTEFMTVTSVVSGTGPYTYSVTRNADGSGANDWKVGDAVVSLGQTGAGFLEFYSAFGLKSSSQLGPAIVGNVRNSGTHNDWTERLALGNLNGKFGYNTDIYGLAVGVPTGAWVKIDPTNGVRIGNDTTTLVSINTSGSTLSGWSISSTQISKGSLKFNSGATPYFGISSGTPQYNASGTPFYADGAGLVSFGNKLTYDGSTATLTLTGVVNSTSGNIGGFTLATSSMSTANIMISGMGNITMIGVLDAGELRVAGNKVMGSRGAAIADADGTLASVTAVANALLARFRASTGHGSISG